MVVLTSLRVSTTLRKWRVNKQSFGSEPGLNNFLRSNLFSITLLVIDTGSNQLFINLAAVFSVNFFFDNPKIETKILTNIFGTAHNRDSKVWNTIWGCERGNNIVLPDHRFGKVLVISHCNHCEYDCSNASGGDAPSRLSLSLSLSPSLSL